MNLRSRVLTTVPDSTSQKFMIVGQVSRKDQKSPDERIAVVYLDFAGTRGRQCEDRDMESWYARSSGHECLMGHKVSIVLRWVWEYGADGVVLAMVQASQARGKLLCRKQVCRSGRAPGGLSLLRRGLRVVRPLYLR